MLASYYTSNIHTRCMDAYSIRNKVNNVSEFDSLIKEYVEKYVIK